MIQIEASFVPVARVFGEKKTKKNAVLGATCRLHHKTDELKE